MVKKWLPWALKLALSGALIWYLLHKIDLAAAIERAKTITPGMLAAAVALMLCQIVLATVRWRAVMGAIDARLPLLKTFEILYIGTFFNIALPSSVGGDAIRMWKGRRAGLSLSAAVNSVMLERFATVLGLVVLVAVTQPLLLARLHDLPGAWVFPLLTLLGFAGMVVMMLLDRLPVSLHHWTLVRGFARLAADSRKLFLTPGPALATAFVVLLAHINLALMVYVLALGLDVRVDMIDCLVLVPPVILVTTLPISIAGWGVREGAMVTAFGFVGVPAESALVMSVLYGLITVATSLPGGLIWLMSSDRSTAPSEMGV